MREAYDSDGQMTLYDPLGNAVKRTKLPKPRITYEVTRNKQFFEFRGPYYSRDISRALAIVERMSRQSVSFVNSRILGKLLT